MAKKQTTNVLGTTGVPPLGRKPPRADKKVLRLGFYVDPEKLAEAVAQLPDEIDFTKNANESLSRVYLNDQFGDCVIAGKYHTCGMMDASDGAPVRTGPDSEVKSQYVRICGPNDAGCVITDVLDECVAGRFMVGGKPFPVDGYCKLDWTNKDLARVAMYLLGPLTLGINLPNDWTTKNVWDVTSSRIVGGHDVSTAGYNANGPTISSWGRIFQMTWAAFISKKWLEECYALLSPEWYGSDKLNEFGISADALKADMDLLKQGRIPEINPAAFDFGDVA